ncbi:DDE-type integrase/transposase/recombinase [Chromobacterium sphagni]|uniref:DDE-type integrase/transposase/recombinase n=1 Tax=Chromobacterium sphagni TaxID=1903179 RepID=UPI000BA36A21
MDFVADQLFNGQKIRALTVVDNFSRESLAITVDFALKAADVVATMQHVQALRGTPQRIQVDNGSECISVARDPWPMSKASRWTSHDQGHPWIMPSSSHLTAVCG